MDIKFESRMSDLEISQFTLLEGLFCFKGITEDGKKFALTVKVGPAYIGQIYKSQYGVRLEIFELSDLLEVRNGLFWPPSKIDKISKDVSVGSSLAYGRRTSSFKYLIALHSSLPLFMGIVSSSDDFGFELEED